MELVRVKSLEHLKELCSKKRGKFRTTMGGGMYIRWSETNKDYRILHCADNAKEVLTERELIAMTNIPIVIQSGLMFFQKED
jgi:hypothetical protein